MTRDIVIPEPSYNIPIALTGALITAITALASENWPLKTDRGLCMSAGIAAITGAQGNVSATAVLGLLAAFLAVQVRDVIKRVVLHEACSTIFR